MLVASLANHPSKPQGSCPFVVAFDQCGLELQTPHMLTTAKRLIPSREVDATALGRDGLRYHGWDADAVRARYTGLDPSSAYELEAVFACERSQHRVLALVVGGAELVPEIALVPGGATTIRVEVPATALRAGVLDVSIERRAGPDALVSELRLFGSVPVAPTLTVVGDSRGGLIGTVSDAEYAGIAGAAVTVTWPGGKLDATSDARGVFNVPLHQHLPQGQHAELTLVTTVAGRTATQAIDTRTLAQGLRELPPADARLDLAGPWQFVPGCVPDPNAPVWQGAPQTRVPGHVAFDGLIPDGGVATLRRTIDIPKAWAGDAVFARFDGAYGRAELFVNGQRAGVHSAGATSFDVELTRLLAPGENVVTLVLTEYTPHAVLDYMSWYAHTSLLGIWREVCLFHVPPVHLGPVDLSADFDPARRGGALEFGADVVNISTNGGEYTLELTVLDAGRTVARTSVAGAVAGSGSDHQRVTLDVPGIEPWSAEVPRLYDLNAILTVAGRVTTYRRRIGFRRIEVVGNQLLVNGTPIRLLGINRHDARLRTGRSMRYEDLRHDVKALRESNVNIIRTAHYPADPRLLELCDELGMYVQDQMPICFAAGFDDHHWTRTNEAAHLVPYLLEVTAETVGRDQGHASVLIWDLANETQWGWGFDVQLALVRQIDPSRPTIFSFDLNQIGEVNPLPRMKAKDRPDIRTYHYPGWDRPWPEDIDWLCTYDQPVVLDECSPPFQDNARAPLHADMLATDPGVRDYWVTGLRPFVARAMREKGCIGGMIWSAVDDQWVLPIDESVGTGNWSHLTKLDYYRVRDVHPPQDGLVFRGEGEWGPIDGWGRARPELWHIHQLYSPIEITQAEFDAAASTLALTLLNRHSHRLLETLDLRLAGAALDGARDGSGARVAAAPGETVRVVVSVLAKAEVVELAFVHPEGWVVDTFRWDVPGRTPDAHASARAGAQPLQLGLSATGDLTLTGSSPWLKAWPTVHLDDLNRPDELVPLPALDRKRASAAPDGTLTVPLTGAGWDGSLSARIRGSEAVFEYTCTYAGTETFDVREIGLAFELPAGLGDLWWHRNADWAAYPPGHIGRPRGYTASAPGPAAPLRPAARWEGDTSPAGTNDYRSTKRNVLAAGATDGRHAVSLLSDGTQHVRAALINGAPVLHVLDWYGGVPFRIDTDHIWTTNFGTGRRITNGTMLQGRVTLVAGATPADALHARHEVDRAEGPRL